jgi:hypothetical protein
MRKLLFVLVMGSLCLCAQDQAPAGGGRGRGNFVPPPPGPAKNLKVLTEAEAGPAMRMAVAGLGVQCDACHNTAAYDSDEKHNKVVARAMFSMVKDINAKFPDGKAHVTCYTCHRGATGDPAMAPPPGGEGGGRGGRGGAPPAQE